MVKFPFLKSTEVFQLSHFSLKLAKPRLNKREEDIKTGMYGINTKKASENFANILTKKMTDLPVTSPTLEDPAPADLNAPAPNQPASPAQ